MRNRRITVAVSMLCSLALIVALWVLPRSREAESATAIENGLIAALVSVAAIGALTAMGNSLSTMFTTVSDALDNAAGSTACTSSSDCGAGEVCGVHGVCVVPCTNTGDCAIHQFCNTDHYCENQVVNGHLAVTRVVTPNDDSKGDPPPKKATAIEDRLEVQFATIFFNAARGDPCRRRSTRRHRG